MTDHAFQEFSYIILYTIFVVHKFINYLTIENFMLGLN